jgi:hypothetical protein
MESDLRTPAARLRAGLGDGKDSCAILTQGPLYPGVTAVAEPVTRIVRLSGTVY